MSDAPRPRRLLMLVLVGLLLASCSRSSPPLTPNGDAVPTSITGEQVAPAAPNNARPRSDGIEGRLLFAHNGTIWLWQGNEPRPLIATGNAWQPAWSPDGERIAYVARGQSYSDLVLANANGQTVAEITANSSDYPLQSNERIYDTMWAFYPVWSPDGQTLYALSQPGKPYGVPATDYPLTLFAWDLTPSGGGATQLLNDMYANLGRFALHPNGKDLVFTRTTLRKDGDQRLHRLDLTTSTVEPYPGTPYRSYDPTFSPDGRWLVYTARHENQTDLWVLPGNAPSGTTPVPQRLTTLGTARAPVFAPDGSQLAFLAVPPDAPRFELWLVNLSVSATGALQADTPRQLTTKMGIDPDSGLTWSR